MAASFPLSRPITSPRAAFPFFERFQRNEQPCGVRRDPSPSAASGEAHHVGDVRVGLDDFHHLPQLPAHGLEGYGLVRLNVAADTSRVLLGKEAFGNDNEQGDVDPHREYRQRKHE